MMNTQGHEELKQCLQQETPDEVEARLGDTLDDAGRAYLAQRRHHPEIEDLLRDSGRYTRERLDNPPEFHLPDGFTWQDEPQTGSLYRAKFGRPLLGILSLAAALVVGVLIGYQHKPAVTFDNKSIINFQRSIGEPGAQDHDRALFLALKARGLFFLEAAKRSESMPYYEEAYKDLSQAWMLDQSDKQILAALRTIQPILQQNYDLKEPE